MNAPVPSSLRVRCHAKVNLGLRIVARRADGYHDLETIFQSISLADDLFLEPAEAPGVELRIEGPQGADLAATPAERNLAVRAWRAAEERLRERGRVPPGWPAGVRMTLNKAIPAGAGLAGGSADAAGALIAARAWLRQLADGTDEGLTSEDLQALGEALGSDVPFCLRGGTAFGTGRGERLAPFPSPPAMPLLLAKPKATVSTAEAYATCTPQGPAAEGYWTGIEDSFRGGEPSERWAPMLENSFFTPTLPHFALLSAMAGNLRTAGAFHVLLSGSGPSFLVFVSGNSQFLSCQDLLRTHGAGFWKVFPSSEGVTIIE